MKVSKIRSAKRQGSRLLLRHQTRAVQMRIAIQADDGDEVSISADVISAEKALVTLQIETALYDSVAEPEANTLTVD
jgi:hypothetical protein